MEPELQTHHYSQECGRSERADEGPPVAMRVADDRTQADGGEGKHYRRGRRHRAERADEVAPARRRVGLVVARVREYPEPKGLESPGRPERQTGEHQRRGGAGEKNGDGAEASDPRAFRDAIATRHEQIGAGADDEECRALAYEQAEAEQDSAGEQADRSPLATASPENEGARHDGQEREMLSVGGDAEHLRVQR